MIDRSDDRIKQTGEVFTPPELVEEILNKLPTDVWQKDKTFLDNSCGDGNFLVAVVEHKIKHGSTVKQALSTTYGIDIMHDNVIAARERLIKKYGKKYKDIVVHNIIQGDGLDPRTYDSFDESILGW